MRKASVIVCTYNRAQSLKDTLQALRGQILKLRRSFEIVVVDNNSRDHTPRIIFDQADESPWPIRYFFEAKQGLSYARNRGIVESQGEFLAFTDDDVIPEKNWLDALWDAFEEHNADAVGGRVLPLWEAEPPAWIHEPRLLGNLALVDHGEQMRVLEDFKGNFIYGANMAFRREIFSELGNFSTELGRKGESLLSGEDTELQKRLFFAGKKMIYVPSAIVHHKIPRERMHFSYFRKWNYEYGRSMALMKPLDHERFPIWLVRQCVANRLKAAAAYLSKSPSAVQHELNFWYQAGQLSGFMHKDTRHAA